MFLLILCIIGTLVTTVLVSRSFGNDFYGSFGDYAMGAIIGLLLGSCVIFSIGAGVSGLVHWAATPSISTDQWNLKSVADSTQTNGAFALGSGIVSESPVYYYYYETGDGRFQQSYTFAYNTYIREGSEKPVLIETKECYSDLVKHFDWFGWDCKVINNEFKVPTGSIVTNTTLDTSAQ